MSAPVYSRLLAEANNPAVGYTDLGGPGESNKWVIRDIHAVNATAPFVLLTGPLLIQDGSLVEIASVRVWNLFAALPFDWNGRHVIEAGDDLTLYVGDSNWQVRISGYVLTLP